MMSHKVGSSPGNSSGGSEQEERGRPDSFPIVGVGSSAGGLEALKTLFGAMPTDSGMAFVLIQHLDPTHESLMVELLARYTSLKVVQIENDMPVEPNRIHVIPPATSLTIRNGILRLGQPFERRNVRMPIDVFFVSLAEDQQERAIGVVLSGTGSDGTLGLREIKARNGLAVVQDPEGAQYDGMPRSAIHTGLVDYVLPADRIPQALLAYHRETGRIERISEPLGAGAEERVQQILALVHAKTGHDFRGYKRNTLVRRLERRMTLNHSSTLADYVEHIQREPDEIDALDRDLLISVTTFFREPESWETLAEVVVGPLLDRAAPGRPVRVWVPGCATGEEAYSLAILLIEECDRRGRNCNVQLYATDIDVDALEVARRGVYGEGIAEHVSAERLARFFGHVGGAYQVTRRLRELVVFAPQNLISDPPFTRLDLVSCRNVLIYVQAELQKRILSLFHFALEDGGILVLGSSESIGVRTDFEPISKRWRIFRHVGATDRSLSALPRSAGFASRLAYTPLQPSIPIAAKRADLARSLLLERFAPSAVLLNAQHEAIFFSGVTRDFLSMPEGIPTSNIVDLVDSGLRPRLRAGLHKVATEHREVVISGARLSHKEESRTVRMTVLPVAEASSATPLFLVTFEYEAGSSSVSAAAPIDDVGEGSVVGTLEQELARARAELQASVEQMEASNEDLKASNEEILSMNEELQSSNEELETSREELQSMNEELSTLNSQLQEKVSALEDATDDLDNLLTSTNFATVFLSPDFRIRRYTDAAKELLNLIPGDVGRPLADMAWKFTDAGLLDDARVVLQTLTAASREVQSHEGKWFIRHVRPYRTSDHRIDGVVLTFADISHAKKAEAAARASELRYRAIFEQVAVGVVEVEADTGRYLAVNAKFCEIVGRTEAELLTLTFHDLVHPDDRHLGVKERTQLARSEIRSYVVEKRIVRPDGSPVWVSITGSRSRLGPSDEGPGSLLGIIEDISPRKRAEATLQKWVHVFEHVQVGVVTSSADGEKLDLMNEAFAVMHGYRIDELRGMRIADVFAPSERVRMKEHIRRANESGHATFESIHLRKDGSSFPVFIDVTAVMDERHAVLYRVVTVQDITERKQAEFTKARLEQQLQQASKLEAIGRLAGGIAHDFNNILQGILGSISLVQMSLSPKEKGYVQLSEASDAATRAITLTRKLLAFGRRQPAAPRPFDLNPAVMAARVMLDRALSFSSVKIDIEVTLADGPLVINADPSQIDQILMNLGINARDAMGQGGVLRIQTESALVGEERPAELFELTPGDYAVLCVSDNGEGMPPETLRRAFEPFFTTKPEGSGLGLASVHGILKQCGGVATVTSAVLQGTTFRLYFPRSSAPLPVTRRAEPQATKERGGTILLVDDEPLVREVVGQKMRSMGYSVLAFANGLDALQWVEKAEQAPDLLVTDVVMPHMNGMVLADKLRTTWSNLKVLFISGYSEEVVPEDVPGQSRFLAKPFALDTFQEVLEQMMAGIPR